MPLKTASSTIALAAAAAFALSSTAFAQTTVGGQEVSDDDLAMVTEHCEMLAGEPASDTMATDDTATDDLAADDDAATDDLAAGTETDGTETGSTTGADIPAEDGTTDQAMVDIDAITIEDCQAAGLAPM